MVTRNPFNSGLRIMVLTVLAPLTFVLSMWLLSSFTNAGSINFDSHGVRVLTVGHR